jgi:hypothetical protein
MSVPMGSLVTGAVCPHCDNSDPATVLAGAVHRQACQKKNINRKTLRDLRSFVKHYLKENVSRVNKQDLPTFEDFLKRTKYTEKEKEKIRAGKEISDKYSPYSLPKRYTKCKCFAKDEFYDEFKQSRGICGRTNVIRARYGPLIMAIEDKIYKSKYFVKHMTPKERSVVISERMNQVGRVLENDYSTFESSFASEIISAVECQLFRHCLGDVVSSDLLNELCDDARGVGEFKTTMLYKWFELEVAGSRKSGDSHTSLANGFTNLMIFLFCCYKADVPHHSFDILVEGDDSVCWLAEGHTVKFRKVAEELGFTVKMNWLDTASESSFCQLRCDPSTGIIVRHPAKVLAKSGWSKSNHVNFNSNHLTMLYRAKAMSLAVESGSCPILWALADRMLRSTTGVQMDWEFVERHTPLYERDKIQKTACEVSEPPLSTRVFFEKLFKIPVSYQLEVEKYLLETRGDMNHPLILDLMPNSWRTMWERGVRY